MPLSKQLCFCSQHTIPRSIAYKTFFFGMHLIECEFESVVVWVDAVVVGDDFERVHKCDMPATDIATQQIGQHAVERRTCSFGHVLSDTDQPAPLGIQQIYQHSVPDPRIHTHQPQQHCHNPAGVWRRS